MKFSAISRVGRSVSVAAAVLMAGGVSAAPIAVTNSDFEETAGLNFNNNGNIGTPNEAFTNPSSFGPGWELTGAAGTSGRYGIQQPRSGTGGGQLFYERSEPAGTTPPGALSGPFSGNFIGFINLDDQDRTEGAPLISNYVQSAPVGNLEAGTYTLNVAVGARAGANWNDILYSIGLVGNPTSTGGAGSTGGTILGIEGTTIMMPPSSPPGSNITDLQYTLVVPEESPLIGTPYAIRITGTNLGTQGGVPNADPNNLMFVQANFDNVRLDLGPVPEPGAMTLLAFGGLLLGRRGRR